MVQKKHTIVGKHEAGERLDRVVPKAFPEISRRQARERIQAGEFWVNGRVVRVQSRQVRSGDRITWLPVDAAKQHPENTRRGSARQDDAPIVHPSSAASREILWEQHGGQPVVVFQDRAMVVLNKPSGIPVEPTPREDLRTCLRQVEALLRSQGVHHSKLYATAVHRLDAATSGLTVFATKKSAARHLSGQFANKSPKRSYLAAVVGIPAKKKDRLVHHLAHTGPGLKRGVVAEGKGKHSALRYEVLETFGEKVALLKVELETGRTHQIRVQMAHIGHPVIGDWLYCSEEKAAQAPVCKRLLLHAHTLELQHPFTERMRQWEAPLPSEFSGYLAQWDTDESSSSPPQKAPSIQDTQE